MDDRERRERHRRTRRFAAGLTLAAALLGACGDPEGDPEVRLQDDRGVALGQGRTFALTIRESGDEGELRETRKAVVASADDPWFVELDSALDTVCRAHVGYDTRFGGEYEPDGAVSVARQTCGVEAVRESALWMCKAYELYAMVASLAVTDVEHDALGQPSLRARRLVEEIPVATHASLTVPVQDPAGRATLLQLAYNAAQNSVLAAAQAWDVNVCPDGSLYGRVPTTVSSPGTAATGPVAYTALAYVLASNTMESIELMTRTGEAAADATRAEGIARAGRIPERAAAARQRMVGRHGSVLEAARVMVNVPLRHFDPAFGTGDVGLGVGVPYGGEFPEEPGESDLDPCDDSEAQEPEDQVAYQLVGGLGLSPAAYENADDAALQEAVLGALQQTLGAESVPSAQASWVADHVPSLRRALGRFGDEARVLGRPLVPMEGAGPQRVHGLRRPGRRAPAAFVYAQIADVVAQHDEGPRHAPVAAYAPRTLLSEPLQYGQGGMAETLDVIASVLAPAFSRRDARAHQADAPAYDRTARILSLARAVARERVPMRVRLSVGHPDEGRLDRVAVSLYGATRPESAYSLWLGTAGLECSTEGTVAGLPCDPAQYRIALAPQIQSGADHSGFPDEVLHWEIEPAQAPGGILPVAQTVFVVEQGSYGQAHAVAGLKLQPGEGTGTYTASTLIPAGLPVMQIIGQLAAPSADDCSEPEAPPLRVPLENELQRVTSCANGSDPYESSWACMLSLAEQSVARTHELGEQLIAHGLQMDLRAEQCAVEAQHACGGIVSPGDNAFTGELQSCGSNDDCTGGMECIAGACQHTATSAWAGSADQVTAQCVGAQPDVLVSTGASDLCAWVFEGVPCGGDFFEGYECPFRPSGECSEGGGLVTAAMPAGYRFETVHALNVSPATTRIFDPSVCDSLDWIIANPGQQPPPDESGSLFDAEEPNSPTRLQQVLAFIEHARFHGAARNLSATPMPWGFGQIHTGARPWLRFGSMTDGPSQTAPCGPMYAVDEDVRAELCGDVPGVGDSGDGVVATDGPIPCDHACDSLADRRAVRDRFARMVWNLQAIAGIQPRTGAITHYAQDFFESAPTLSEILDALQSGLITPPHSSSVQIPIAGSWPSTLCAELGMSADCLDGPYGTAPTFIRWNATNGHAYYGLSLPAGSNPPARIRQYAIPWRMDVPPGAAEDEMLLSQAARSTLWSRDGGAIETLLIRYATDPQSGAFGETSVADFLVDNYPAYFRRNIDSSAWESNCRWEGDDSLSAANEDRWVCDMDLAAYREAMEDGYLPSVIGDTTVRELLDALSLGCRAAAYEGGVVGCPADLDQLPQVSSVDDLPELSAHLHCVQERLDQTAANMVFTVPGSVLASFQQEGTPLAPGATYGQFTVMSAQIENDLRDIGAAMRTGTTAVRDFSLAVERVHIARQTTNAQIEIGALQNEIADVDRVVKCSQALSHAANAWVGAFFGGSQNPILSFTEAGTATGDAAAVCATGLHAMILEDRITALEASIHEAEFRAALIELVQQYAATMDALRNAIDGVHTAASMLQGHLAELQTNRQDAVRAVACATFADEAGGQEFPVNTVMRRVMDIRRGQYERSLDQSRFYLRLARAAIEEHFGVDLEGLQSPLVSGGEAPSSWANDVETLSGIDYAALRTSTPGDSTDWSRQTPMEYYQHLRDFVVQYQLAYNFQDEESTAVLSLRDDILGVREECEQESYNLLLSSDDFNAMAWTTYAGGAVGERDVWPSSAPGAAEVFRYRYTQGGGYLVRPMGATVPYTLHATCAAPPCAPSTADGFGQDGIELRSSESYVWSWIEAVDVPGVDAMTGACTAQSGLCADACAGDPEGATCQVQCAWWTCQAECAAGLADASCQACQQGTVDECVQDACATVDPAGQPAVQPLLDGAPVSGAAFLDAQHDDWIDVCRYRRAAVAIDHPTTGLYRLAFRPVLGADPNAPDVPVVLAAPQLERRPAVEVGIAPEPRTYFGTDADGLRMVPACIDRDGSTFRSQHWTYACEWVCPWGLSSTPCAGQRRCYYETTFQQSHTNLDRLTGTPFVHGSYNYRFRNVAVSLVGLGVRLCETEGASSSCYGTGYVPFALHHDGPFFTRNHFGEEHQSLLFDGRVSGFALAMDRYLTNPVQGSDASQLDYREELAGRPLSGHFRLRIYDSPELDWDAVEDVQLLVDYRYWTRSSR